MPLRPSLSVLALLRGAARRAFASAGFAVSGLGNSSLENRGIDRLTPVPITGERPLRP